MEDTDWFAEQEHKQERCYWRRVGFLLFGAILFAGALALLLAPKANAAEVAVARNGNDAMRLYNEPCGSEAIAAKLKPEIRPRLRHGETTLGGVKYPMCWLIVGPNVVAIYEDGELGQWPTSGFEREQ